MRITWFLNFQRFATPTLVATQIWYFCIVQILILRQVHLTEAPVALLTSRTLKVAWFSALNWLSDGSCYWYTCPTIFPLLMIVYVSKPFYLIWRSLERQCTWFSSSFGSVTFEGLPNRIFPTAKTVQLSWGFTSVHYHTYVSVKFFARKFFSLFTFWFMSYSVTSMKRLVCG